MSLYKNKKSDNLSSAYTSIKEVKQIEYFDTRFYKILFEQEEIIKKKKVKKLYEDYFVSVTEILSVYPKDFLARWRGDVGNERADQILYEAEKLGSFIHYAAEVLANGGVLIYNPVSAPIYSEKEIQNLMAKHKDKCVIVRFQKEFIQLYRIWQFFKEVNPVKVETEQKVFSIAYKYAGTLDLLMYIKGGTYNISGSKPLELEEGYYVADYKTGKYTSETYSMQIAAYAYAVMEGLPDINIKGGLIIQPNNDRITTGIEGLKTTFVSKDDIKQFFDYFLAVYEVYKIKNPQPSPKEFTMPSILSLK